MNIYACLYTFIHIHAQKIFYQASKQQFPYDCKGSAPLGDCLGK